MAQQYNTGGTTSTVGEQFNDFLYKKKALVEARKKQVFTQLAESVALPKHFGKEIRKYQYIPVLHDANINDQGIDPNGATTTRQKTIVLVPPAGGQQGEENLYVTKYAVGEGANDTDATTNAQNRVVEIVTKELGLTAADYNAAKSALAGLGYTVDESRPVVPVFGNLYGSSKDIGRISGKLPTLSEVGGRVNRVGFKRKTLKGSIQKFGFFDEYTKESLDFDTDEQLEMHIHREMVNAAVEISEAKLQIDLLNAAGIVRYPGTAMSTAQISGESGSETLITYEDLMRLSIDLDNARCPKDTKVITGTRLIDTKVISSARVMYVGSELIPMLRSMRDSFNNPVFIDVKHYAHSSDVIEGEIGSIDQFRIVVVPEMLHWAGAGATVTNNAGYRETNGKYDVFPMLVVGRGAFSTIGFQTNGDMVNFVIKHSKPESDIAYSESNPYGEIGFMSIKWYYGTLIERPERIALIKVPAKW
jgi:N4-gp56 family major capsid protein